MCVLGKEISYSLKDIQGIDNSASDTQPAVNGGSTMRMPHLERGEALLHNFSWQEAVIEAIWARQAQSWQPWHLQ